MLCWIATTAVLLAELTAHRVNKNVDFFCLKNLITVTMKVYIVSEVILHERYIMFPFFPKEAFQGML